MNIVMLMAGGVGRRFESMIPKQYNLLCGLLSAPVVGCGVKHKSFSVWRKRYEKSDYLWYL